jgi:hypothetical protein
LNDRAGHILDVAVGRDVTLTLAAESPVRYDGANRPRHSRGTRAARFKSLSDFMQTIVLPAWAPTGRFSQRAP